MTAAVDEYIEKSEIWQEEMRALRAILLRNGLQEEIKWSKPAYLSGGRIVAVMQPFKKYFALLFYNGNLLNDEKNLLVPTGPNTRKGRQMRIKNTEEIKNLEADIENLIRKAKEIT